MSTLVLPPCFSHRGEMTWDRPGSQITVGQTGDGEVQQRTMGGGGRWRANLQGLGLNTPDLKRTWEAILERIELGDSKFVVLRQTFDMRPAFAGALADTSWSDDTTFDDDTLFESGSGLGTLEADIALRATSLQVRLPTGGELRGGEAFSLTGPTYGVRLYRVAAITDVDGDVTTITFGPPAREPYEAGIDVDFERPRCTMRAMVSDGSYPTYTRSRFATANMVFWETTQ